MSVEIYLDEIGDIHYHIERGPRDTVELVKIRRINHTDSPDLTPEQGRVGSAKTS
jgi:hypothetical protein